MSDAAGGAVAESAAPTVDSGAEPVKTNEAPKPRTIDDDLGDVFKKYGGYEYAKGKKLDSPENLKRMLGRVTGVDSAAAEALKKSQKADALEAKIAQIAKLKGSEMTAAIKSLGLDDKAVRAAFEDEILAEADREKEQQGMSERERQYARRNAEQEAELKTFKQQQEAAKKAQEQEQYVARVTEVGKRLEGVTVAALQRAKIPPESAPHFLQAIAERLDRNERLGLGLDEAELADVVLKEQEDMASGFLKSKASPDLADMLEAQGVAKPLMEEFAKRIRAKANGGAVTPIAVSNGQARPQGQTDAEKMAFWRGR